MSILRLLAAGRRIPFRYETRSPYACPIVPGIRRAIAKLRRAGRRPEYFLRLEHGFFVYYVRVTKPLTKATRARARLASKHTGPGKLLQC